MAQLGHLHSLTPHTKEVLRQTLPSVARSLPSPSLIPQWAWPQHLHTLHPEHPPGPAAVLRPAQGLPVLMPGDIGWGGAPGIAAELQGGTKGQ